MNSNNPFSNLQPEGKQNEVLALPAVGHTIVLGTAGSGKTTMALWRAVHLANLPKKPNVLVVTFNGALVQYMKKISNFKIPNLTIENYHKFACGYLNSVGKMKERDCIVKKSEEKERYISAILEQAKIEFPEQSTFKRPVSVFVDEIAFIEKFGIETLEDYIIIERVGRASVNIKRDRRKFFFEIYKRYIALREKHQKLYDWDDIALYVYKELQSDKRKRMYDHIIVDEGQDFSPMMIKSLISATDKNGSFTFFGDVAQQIYGSRLSWRDSGINANNNIWKFDINYRNPATISAFAKDIANSEYWERNMDMVSPQFVIAEGPKPVLIRFDTCESEFNWIIKVVIENATIFSNLIICRNRKIIKSFDEALRKKGIISTIINKKQAGFSNIKGVCLSTFHAAKGLEFENVFIPYLSKDLFPDNDIIENAISEAVVFADELKLLYVAVTRSKFGLYMSYHERLSRLFPKESENYDKANGEEL